MNREELLLIALASESSSNFSPVQIQKTIFLFQKVIPSEGLESPFQFSPYHYGPFDSDIYKELNVLATKTYVFIENNVSGLRKYGLTNSGFEIATKLLSDLDASLVSDLKNLASNIKKLSFTELVNLIYKIYPEMAKNSIAMGIK